MIFDPRSFNLLQSNAFNGHRPVIYYLYKGGSSIPLHVTHIRIDKSVKVIPDELFSERDILEVEMHDGVYKIGKLAFYNCLCLERISGATGVRVIDDGAFYRCKRMKDIELGKSLERIGLSAFARCSSIQELSIPSVKIVEGYAFQFCVNMTSIEFGEVLEQLREFAFLNCYSLQRVAIPLKDDLIRDNIFKGCNSMVNIGLVGGVREKISHFSLQTWTDEMSYEIDRINPVLAAIPATASDNENTDEKTVSVQQWLRRVIARLDHFANEHNRALEEGRALLELSLWKCNLLDETDHGEPSLEDKPTKRLKIDVKSARQERRMTCGANIVIKNVIPFLQLK